MRSVREGSEIEGIIVKKDALMSVLENNRKNHRALFDEALDAYGKKLENELEQKLVNLRKGREPDIIFHLIRPTDHTPDYDRIITMVEMSVDVELELTEQEFAQYVLDQWNWKQQFVTSYMSNTGKELV